MTFNSENFSINFKSSMEIIITKTQLEASEYAANIVATQVRKNPASVLGLATGGTPLQLYSQLIKMHREDSLDFSGVKTFNLDEYVGLPADNENSYNYFMHKNFFDHVNVLEENVNIPDGMAEDIPSYCKGYEQKIRGAGGIDIQILGIGSDAHIGFNEPSSSFASRTRIKALAPQTIKDNARFFGGDESKVPQQAITMGIGTIMESKMCILLAFGESKADAVAACVEGGMSILYPASILQMHPNAKIIVDEPAASKLKLADYYKWAFSKKPEWQMYK